MVRVLTVATVLAAMLAVTGVRNQALAESRPGIHTYRVPAARLSLDLPATWKQIDSRTLLTDSALSALVRSNPSLSAMVALLTQPNPPVKFFAVDPHRRNGFFSSANVTVGRLPRAMGQDEFLRATRASLAAIEIRGQNFSLVKLPGGTAVRATYQFHLGTPSGKIWLSVRQYAFRRGLSYATVTYTTLPGLDRLYQPSFLASAASIRFMS
jgi:hypothetical protein